MARIIRPDNTPKLNRETITRMVARQTGYTFDSVDEVIGALLDVIKQNVLRGKECRLGYITIGNKVIPEQKKYDVVRGKFFIKEEHVIPFATVGRGLTDHYYGKRGKTMPEQ